MSVPITTERQHKKTMYFFPYLLSKNIVIGIVMLGIVVTLAVLLPKDIGNKADPLAPAPAGIRPEWFFVFLFQTLKYLPSKILFVDGELVGLFIIGLGVIFLFLVPFLDRKARRGERSRLFTAITIFLLVYIVSFTISGYIPTGTESSIAIQNSENTVTSEEANTGEEIYSTLTKNRILGLIGFWCILLFIIVFLILKVRHYDQLVKQGYYGEFNKIQ